MKKKDVKLFDKTIHEVKAVIADIKRERDEHRKQQQILTRTHDKVMKKDTKKLLHVVGELYELFTDLTTEEEE